MRNLSKQDKLFLKELGQRISEIREEKGITQVELGFQADMEKSNVNRIEKGGTNPTILTLRRICTALKIDIAELFTDEKEEST